MELLNYVRSLVPMVERKEVLLSIDTLRNEVTQYTLPMSQDMTTTLKDHKYASKIANDLHRELGAHVRFSGKSAIDVTHGVLAKLPEFLGIIEEKVKRAFSAQFTTTSLTFERANLLQLIDMITFYVKYHRRLLLELLAQETKTIGKATASQWPKGYHVFLKESMTPYSALTAVFMVTSTAFKQQLSNLSNAEISEGTVELARKSLGVLKTDPFGLERNYYTHTRTWINPIFSWKKYRAEMEAKRFHASREEKSALELRLQEYRELQEDKGANPKLQKLITHTESRIETLHYEITKTEEENRYDD